MDLDKIAEKYWIDFGKEYRIAVDYENNAEEWWDGGGRELWEAFSGGEYRDERVASGDEIMAFLAEAEKIQGWADGPDNAKYSFCVFDAE